MGDYCEHGFVKGDPCYGCKDAEIDRLRAKLAEERIKELETERDALGDAMRKLVDKLTEIERHPAFGAVFALASMRGMGYSGPNWEPELTEARAALQSCASAQQDDPSPAGREG